MPLGPQPIVVGKPANPFMEMLTWAAQNAIQQNFRRQEMEMQQAFQEKQLKAQQEAQKSAEERRLETDMALKGYSQVPNELDLERMYMGEEKVNKVAVGGKTYYKTTPKPTVTPIKDLPGYSLLETGDGKVTLVKPEKGDKAQKAKPVEYQQGEWIMRQDRTFEDGKYVPQGEPYKYRKVKTGSGQKASFEEQTYEDWARQQKAENKPASRPEFLKWKSSEISKQQTEQQEYKGLVDPFRRAQNPLTGAMETREPKTASTRIYSAVAKAMSSNAQPEVKRQALMDVLASWDIPATPQLVDNMLVLYETKELTSKEIFDQLREFWDAQNKWGRSKR